MSLGVIKCARCRKEFLKDQRYIRENIKLSHNFFCSFTCQYSFKNKKIELLCENPRCGRKIKRKPKDISPHNYCSRSCAISINNTKFPKRRIVQRNCPTCGRYFVGYTKNCSVECRNKAAQIREDIIINDIKRFYEITGRIPLKREFLHGHSARKRFGTWNQAIEAAGFKPNPVMFAKKQVAKDGHICDSIAEKIIDDYLFEKGILHERNIPYPGGKYTTDFKIGDKYVEYFGLAGEHIEYDEIKKLKLKIAKKYKFKLIEIYPKDLYAKRGLERILGV